MIPQPQKIELLTVDEASEVLRLKPSTVRAWILRRRLPYIKLGGRVFLRSGDLRSGDSCRAQAGDEREQAGR